MRVISVQDSFQDRTLKEDNFNLLVQKNRELKDQRGSWLVYEYGLKSFLQKKLKILFLLERSELWCLSSTNSLMFNSFKFNKFITHTKKCNSAWADFFFFFCTVWIKFKSWHLWFSMSSFRLPLCYASTLNCLIQAYFSHETFQPLEYCYHKVAIKQLVGHISVSIILTFWKTQFFSFLITV